MSNLTKDEVVTWLELTNTVMAENKEYLTDLDSAIGDADHGNNMARGFKKVVEKLESTREKDIATILKTTGMTLMSSVGGASGPLYGTFFTQMSSVAREHESLDSATTLAMLQAGVAGVQKRGRAEAEDKTMIDAWLPALDAMQKSLVDNGDDLSAMLQAGVDAAEQGAKATIPLQARKGRASYLGERSIGHQDPGATSSHLVLQALLNAVEQS